MQNIDVFGSKEAVIIEEKSKVFLIFELVVVLFLISLTYFIFFYKYSKLVEIKGMIKGENIIFVLEESNMQKLCNNKIILDDKLYSVEIISIEEPVYDNNMNLYYSVNTKINLSNKYLVNNNVVDLHIYLGKTTLAKEIFRRIKGVD